MGGDDSEGVEDDASEGTTDSTDSSSGNSSGNAFITILSTGAYRVKGTVNEINRDSIIEGTPVTFVPGGFFKNLEGHHGLC